MGARGPEKGASARRPPTATMLETLRFMARYHAERQLPPTLREMATAAGVSSGTAILDRLKALERRGLIEGRLPPSCGRRMFVTEKGKDLLRCEEGEKLLVDIERRIAE